MNKIWKAYRIFDYVKLAGVWISSVAILVMMGLIVYDVVARTLFSSSIRGGFEIVQNYMLPLAVFPGLAYVYASGVLPKMDILLDKVNGTVQKIFIYIMLAVELFVLVLIVQFSWEYAMDGLARKTAFPAAGTLYPVYPLFFLIPIAFALIILENVFILLRNLFIKEPTLVMVKTDSKPEELL